MKAPIDNKNEVVRNSNIVLIVFGALAVLTIAQVINISVVKGKYYRDLGREWHIKAIDINADRGNILADNGELLATSMPFYDVYFDPTASRQYVKEMKEKDKHFMKKEGDIFAKNIDSLAFYISKYLNPNLSQYEVKSWILKKRSQNERYLCLAKGISHSKMKMVKNFPLFRLGRNKSGVIFEVKPQRVRPYGDMALRTVGYIRDNTMPIGIEGKYNEDLKGEAGKRMVQYIAKNRWVPINDLTEIEPRNGNDVRTTLNVQMQDIARSALQEALEYHNASYGSVIVMEVKTGAIKAMANLKKDGDKYQESYNYAVGASTEPGSTFKLASMMAILEDKKLDLDYKVDVNYGKAMVSGREMKDSEGHGHATLTLREAFEKSSNIGISKAVVASYGQNRNDVFQYINRIKQFHLDKLTGIDLAGEGKPLIKTPYNLKQLWSRTSLAWMAHGYETQLTPLQMLTFYNAVANDGKMMQPYLVSSVWSHGEEIKSFLPKVLEEKIANDTTIRLAKELLEGVVLRGTAKKFKNDLYSFAGKTGTASLDYGGVKRGRYRASFIGYFPAENPIYSICVSITEPRDHGYHGSEVALPVFKSIADKVLSFDPHFFNISSPGKNATAFSSQLPQDARGNRNDFVSVFNRLGVPVYTEGKATDLVITKRADAEVNLVGYIDQKGQVPDVKGMGLRDALFALESQGLIAEVSGYGRVSAQNIPPGTKVSGQKVFIKLQ